MGRSPRPNLPGTPFHLAARIQWREPLLAELRATILRLVHEEARGAGMRLVAYALMSNHLHLVAIQGPRPLGWFMQPLLRRIALAVMRRHDREGHVFERRFFAVPCSDPEYMRTVITYLHLNPVRAGLCATPDESDWTSHAAYAGSAGGTGSRVHALADAVDCGDWAAFAMTVESALRLFAPVEGMSLEACRQAYRGYVNWRMAADAALLREGGDPPSEPLCTAGDLHWARDFAPAASRLQPPTGRRHPPDLREIALRVLRDHSAGVTLDLVRGGGSTRPVVAARRAVITHSLNAGYRPAQIARYLRISPSTVSAAAAAQRLRGADSA
jgi:REP element-mobilizing transposase RayT